MAGGAYDHFGAAKSILITLESFSSCLDEKDTLTLHVNIDGLPLFRSSTVNLWPILGMIKELPDSDPFVIGVYSGSTNLPRYTIT